MSATEVTFRKVVVPSDGSALSEGVLDPVERLLGGESAVALYLLQVLDGRAEDAAIQEARARLALIERRYEAEGFEFEAHVRKGDAASEILSLSEDVDADLIAMSTHGHTGVERLVRGSVAERILRTCQAPLLLANAFGLSRWDTGLKRVLVPLDGSQRAGEILPLAQTFCRRFGAELTIVHVSEPDEPTWPEDRRAQVQETVDRLAETGQPVSYRNPEGRAAAGILAEAEEEEGAALLAMTTHGWTGLDRWAYGSVAENVLRLCPLPLLVLRNRG